VRRTIKKEERIPNVIDGELTSDLVHSVLLLNFFSFYYFGLSLLTGTAFLYFLFKQKRLPKTFWDYQMFLFSLCLWSLTWTICNTFLAEWTAYVFVFGKNPAVLLLGTSILSASFHLGQNHLPQIRSKIIFLSYLLSLFAVIYNSWGFFHREIVFDSNLEFYVPVQYSPIPLVQGSILSIAIVVSIQLLSSLIVLSFKYPLADRRTKKQILSFLFAALSIFSMSLLNIFVDMQLMGNDTYLFILTNVTFIAVTIVIVSVLNQENVPSNVGFKIISFNITLIYLVLSLIANIHFSKYKMDFMNDLEREKDFVKTQIEKGTIYPIVYQADLLIDLDQMFVNINKYQKSITAFENLKTRTPSFSTFKLEKSFSGVNGILWMSDFFANNHHFVMGLSYKDYRGKIHAIVLWLILTLFSTLIALYLLYPILHKNSIINPLNRLLSRIHQMQRGDLNSKIEITTFDEIGLISASFNDMIAQVRDSKENLEALIRNRTEELQQKLIELKSTQSQLLLAERLSTLGKIAAGVAHEINNPLAAIKASTSFLKDNSSFAKLEADAFNNPIREKIFNLLFEKMQSHSGPIHSKLKRKRELALVLESLGFAESEDLSDTCFDLGITEIPDETRKLISNEDTRIFFRKALEQRQIVFHLKIIETAIDRASKIVFALRHYSYSGPKENKVTFNLKQGIDEVLQMYATVWKQGTQIDVNVDDQLFIFGYPDELVQVWTNLIYNSLQATANINGIVEIFSQTNENRVSIFVKDNGHGIPKENLGSIFEPFFTTKELGMGTGLGLPIVKKIIDAHGGEVKVESVPGKTVFEVILPLSAHT
jgi:signal transduction histidine kinase